MTAAATVRATDSTSGGPRPNRIRAGSGPSQFNAPHALAFDSRGRLFVGDRGNNRIQLFDQNGRFLEEWRQFGRPSGIYIDRNDMLYAADSESAPEGVVADAAGNVYGSEVTEQGVKKYLKR